MCFPKNQASFVVDGDWRGWLDTSLFTVLCKCVYWLITFVNILNKTTRFKSYKLHLTTSMSQFFFFNLIHESEPAGLQALLF